MCMTTEKPEGCVVPDGDREGETVRDKQKGGSEKTDGHCGQCYYLCRTIDADLSPVPGVP